MVDRQRIRARLTEELAALRARAERIEDHQHEREREVPKDSEDLAQFREGDEVVERLDSMTRQEIARIEGALARMDSGTWGACGKCREAIEDERLELVPTAVTCAKCAPR